MISFLYRIYQIIVLAPVTFLATVWAGSTMVIMCTSAGWLRAKLPFSLGLLTRPDWWGTFAGRVWAKVIIRTSLLSVTVEGRENIRPGQSYVFVANHQGSFDIFLVCGYLGVEIRWMMKRALEKVPFLGTGCRHAGYIYVDKGSAGKVRATYRRAEAALKGGASLMVFPEGARTFTGHMGIFRRGAFTLADELQLPVVPLTINGSFDVMPRMKGHKFVKHHPLRLTIHKPIFPTSQGAENIQRLMEESYAAINSALEPQYQGFVENPDQ